MKQDWTEQIFHRLDSYEEEVGDNLWASIQQQMAARRRRARMVFWRRWAAAAACVLLLIGGWTLFRQAKPDGTVGEGCAVAAVSQDEGPVAAADTLYEVEEEQRDVRPSRSMPVRHDAAPARQMAQTEQPVVDVSEDDYVPQPVQTGEVAEIEQVSSQAVEGTEIEQVSSQADGYDDVAIAQVTTPVARRRQLSLSLHGQNLWAEPVTSADEPLLLARRAAPANASADTQIYMYDHSVQTEHGMPLSVGLSLQYPLSEHLWLESGLSYTYLSSSFKRTMPAEVMTDKQRLTYLGIPVRMGFDLWHSLGLTVYGSAGIQADFCVKSTMTTMQGQRDFTRDRVQFSFGIDAGASYEFVRQLSLYFQPSLHYYPDNGSKVENIYTDHPLQLTFQLGLRYTLR